jgi:hypothetical protein
VKKQNVTSAIFGAVAVLCVYLLNTSRFQQQDVWTSAITFGLSVAIFSGSLSFLWRDPNTVQKIATLGPRLASTSFALAAGAAAVGFGLAGAHSASHIAAVLSIVAIGMSIFATNGIATKVAEIEQRIDVKGQHSTWQSDISRAAVNASNPDLQVLLTKLSDDARYIASDVPGETSDVDGEIQQLVGSLRPLVTTGLDDEVASVVAKIRGLFAERELILKDRRR